MTTRILGRYIISDPSICHGEPTFRGTRILVKDVLEQVESGMDWEVIIEEWRGKVSHVGIRLWQLHARNYLEFLNWNDYMRARVMTQP